MRRCFRTAALIVLAWSGFAHVARAQVDRSMETPPGGVTPTPTPRRGDVLESPVTLIASVGFDPQLPTAKKGTWTRISVLLTNDGKSVDGYVEIRKRENYSLIYRQPFSLPINSRKLWTGYILADETQGELVVEYCSNRGKRMAREPVTYFAREIDDDFVLGIVPELQRRGLRSFVNIARRESSSFSAVVDQREEATGRFLLYTDTALLPREVLGYDSVSAFLWDGGSLTQLDPERSLALRGWVFKGGTLIVAGGENAEAIRQSFLKEMLPVEISGTESADVTGAFQETFGSAPDTGGPVVLAAARVVRGNTLLGTEGRPLVVEGRYGAGRVVFVAFSLTSPIRNWKGKDALLEMLFRPGNVKATRVRPPKTRILAALTGEARRIVDLRLRSSLLAELPSPLFVIAFLGVYILLVVPVNYFVFRSFKRIEYAWFALPVIAIVFGLIAYNIGYFSQSRTLDADEITFVEGVADSQMVSAKTFLAIYSPTKINEKIRFPEEQVLARPLVAEGFAMPGMRPGQADSSTGRNPLTVTYENGFDVEGFIIHPWAARSLECDFVTDLGGKIQSQLVFGSSGVEGTIKNLLNYDLFSAALITPPGRLVAIGDLRNGETVNIADKPTNDLEAQAHNQIMEALNRTRRAMQDPYRGRFGPWNQGQMTLFQDTRNIVGQHWCGGAQARLVSPDTCILFGAATRSLLNPEIGRKARSRRTLNRRAQTVLHFIALPVDVTAGQMSLLGADIWSVEPLDESLQPQAMGYNSPLFDYGNATGKRRNVYQLAAGNNDLAIRPKNIGVGDRNLDSLKIDFGLDKKTFRQGNVRQVGTNEFKVALYDFAGNRWEEQGSKTSIEVPAGAAKYFDRRARELRMRITITAPDVSAAQPRRGNPTYCFLRDVKVSAVLEP